MRHYGGVEIREKGQLNPEWVAWLMGWPIGWTELARLETDRFRQWSEMFLDYLRDE